MKRHLLLLSAAMMAVAAIASPLTPEQALARAIGNAPAGAPSLANQQKILVHTQIAPDMQPAAYVFADAALPGYVVVSADEVAVPVLGYSEDGIFDPQNENLQYWLGEYAREIAYAKSIGATCSQNPQYAPANWAKIAPLCKTIWDQGSPFNDLCPKDGNYKSVTGCVATAMAQLMKYHNYPPQGTGAVTYTTETTKVMVSCNFADYTYKWDQMINNYMVGSTPEQKTAVAELMLCCGVAVRMNYTSEASGAQSADAATGLLKYFNYDKGMSFLARDYFSLSSWQTAIYENIKNVGPVFYAGVSDGGGHAFVCDGYDTNGYFHFNWGWSGTSDGYYLLTALDPESQGIGGSSTSDGFNRQQRIILGAKPAQASSDYSYYICNNGAFNIKTAHATLGSSIKCSGAYSYSLPTISGTMGLLITSSNGNAQYVAGQSFAGLNIQTGYNELTLKLPSSLANGTYTIEPAWQLEGSDQARKILCPVNGVSAYKMTVSGNNVTFDAVPYDAAITISSIESLTPAMYAGKRLRLEAKATNSSNSEFYSNIAGALYKNSSATSGSTPDYTGATMLIDVEPGQSETFEYITSFSAPSGTYTFRFINPDTKEWLSDAFTMELKTAPTNSTYDITNFGLHSGDNTVNDCNNMMFSFDIACTTGYLDEQLMICIVQGENKPSDGTWKAFFQTSPILLYAGESKEVTTVGTLVRPRNNTYYTAYLVKGTANYNHEVLAGPYVFLYDPNYQAGIENVGAVIEPAAVEYYNLQGVRVDKASKGLYIKVSTYADGTRSAERVIVK